MSARSQNAPISVDAFNKMARVYKQVRQTLPRITIPRRQTYDQFDLVPMVCVNVSGVYTNPTPGTPVGENVAIVREYRAGAKLPGGGVTGDVGISAKPLIEPVSIDIQKIPGEIVQVSTRMLDGPLFTGQIFLMSPIRTYNKLLSAQGDADWEYVCGCSGYFWDGVVEDEINNIVQLAYNPLFTNATARIAPAKCRVFVSNLTGNPLQAKQNVLVSWVQDHFAVVLAQCSQ